MMKRQEQSEMEATLAVVLLCARFYMHGPIHENPKKNGIHFGGRVPFYREENLNTERLGNLSQGHTAVRDTDGI